MKRSQIKKGLQTEKKSGLEQFILNNPRAKIRIAAKKAEKRIREIEKRQGSLEGAGIVLWEI